MLALIFVFYLGECFWSMAGNKINIGIDGINLPYSLDAENAVLGAILMESSCMDRVAIILPKPDYFYSSSNRIVYSVIMDLYNLSKPIDYITVLESLRNNEDFDTANGRQYLLQVAQSVPSISNVEYYANIVREKYEIRTLIINSREIIEDATNSDYSSEQLLDLAEQKIFDIRNGKSTSGLQKIDEIIIQTFDRLDLVNSPDSDEKAISTGISSLDNVITGLNRSDLILLAARPGMGKTSFALNIAKNAAIKEKRVVAFFSLEMSREQLASRLLSTEGKIEGSKLRTGKLNSDEWVRLVEAGEILSKTKIYFDDTPGITVPEMKAKLRRLKKVDLVVIDYLQLMSSARRIDNRVQEISEITRSLKIMAKELNIPVMTLSQLSRASDQRAEHRPQLSDLRDSGSIEQDADIVLFLYREGYYTQDDKENEDNNKNSGECIVAKNRHGESRTVPLYWQGEYMRFTGQEVEH